MIYPLSVREAAAMEEGATPDQRWAALDRRLDGLMKAVRLAYLVKREGGWSATASWGDTLSLGNRSLLSHTQCGDVFQLTETPCDCMHSLL